MAQTTLIKTKIAELGLNINAAGLFLQENLGMVRAQPMVNGVRANKDFRVSDFDSLKSAIQAADNYRKFYKATSKKPNPTNLKLIESGYDIADDYRGIYIIPGKNNKSRWHVSLRNKAGTHHSRTFAFENDSKSSSRRAMKLALKYREEIMGDILRLNPKTSIMDREHIVGRSSAKNLIKYINMKSVTDGVEVGVSIKGQSYKKMGKAKTMKQYKSLVKKAVRERNTVLGLDTKRISLDPVASHLREFYLDARGL